MVHAYPCDSSIARIASGVLDRSLPKSEWTHPAHFAVALWLLRHQAGFIGRRDMPGIIRAYNLSTGTPNTATSGYHHTITLASLAAAGAALLAAAPQAPSAAPSAVPAVPAVPLHVILDDLLSGPCGRSDWLLTYWTRARLFSSAARSEWVEPDIAALPFILATH